MVACCSLRHPRSDCRVDVPRFSRNMILEERSAEASLLERRVFGNFLVVADNAVFWDSKATSRKDSSEDCALELHDEWRT